MSYSCAIPLNIPILGIKLAHFSSFLGTFAHLNPHVPIQAQSISSAFNLREIHVLSLLAPFDQPFPDPEMTSAHLLLMYRRRDRWAPPKI